MKIRINNKITISQNSKTLIIAEISANHNGNKKRFIEHILRAKKSGADLVKIQSYEENDISLDLRKLKKNFNLNNNYEVYKKTKTPYEWHKEAFEVAKKNNIVLFSSPFSIKSVELLEKLKCPIYKIASLEITDFALIKKIAQTQKPIIMSCGASHMEEVKAAVKIINKYHNKLIILYCRTSYPLKEKLANLSTISDLKNKFKNNFIGYSDHTNDNNTSIIASILGAKIIEKHFIIDNKKTFDSKFSIKPKQLLELQNILKKDHEIIGNKKPYLLKDELLKRSYRRSLYAKHNIKVGDKFTIKNIVSLRPKIGLCSSKYFKLINKISKKRYLKNSPISTNEVL